MAHKFSFIFLGSSGTTIKHIHCSRQKLIGISALFLAGICALTYLSFDYILIHKHMAGKASLERELALQTEEVLHQREQIQKFAVEINELKDKLLVLDQFEQR